MCELCEKEDPHRAMIRPDQHTQDMDDLDRCLYMLVKLEGITAEAKGRIEPLVAQHAELLATRLLAEATPAPATEGGAT